MRNRIRIQTLQGQFVYERCVDAWGGAVWRSDKGSDVSEAGETLVLLQEGDGVVACDAIVTEKENYVEVESRRRVFRSWSSIEEVVEDGFHRWWIKDDAKPSDTMDVEVLWLPAGKYETRVID